MVSHPRGDESTEGGTRVPRATVPRRRATVRRVPRRHATVRRVPRRDATVRRRRATVPRRRATVSRASFPVSLPSVRVQPQPTQHSRLVPRVHATSFVPGGGRGSAM